MAEQELNTSPLYSFSIEELYDYDLPNIRRPSEALTAMAQQPAISTFTKGRLAPATSRPATSKSASEAEGGTESEEETGEARLKNGDEAANFFARNGNHTPGRHNPGPRPHVHC